MGEHKVDLKKKGEFYQSSGLELTKILKRINKKKVLLKFKQSGKTICLEEYVGVKGD